MIYQKEDLSFDKISHSEFERLCYELLLKYGYTKVTWRQGGADNGRDIEGSLHFNNQLHQHYTKWFFECKRYAGGVNVEQLTTKVAWAEAEKADYLVFFISSYITNSGKEWLEKIRKDKNFKIVVIEGEELKERLIKFPDLIERFFSTGRYERLFADIKNHWFGYSIDPSFEVLKDLADHLNAENVSVNELGFLFVSFYKQYEYFRRRNDYYGDFEPEIMAPFYNRLQEVSTQGKLTLLEQFHNDFSHLGGSGIFDSVEFDDIQEEYNVDDIYQYYVVHLNPGSAKDHWAIGHYVFFRMEDGNAFELFSLENSDFTTAIRFLPALSMQEPERLTLQVHEDVAGAVKNYFKHDKIRPA